jgi:hypothetical protein
VGSGCIDPRFLDAPEKAPGNQTGGWVGPTAGLDDMEKWQFVILPVPHVSIFLSDERFKVEIQ